MTCETLVLPGFEKIFTSQVKETETQIKNRKLDAMALARREEIEVMRRFARELVYKNSSMKRHNIPNIVTSEDIRELMNITVEKRNQHFKCRNNYLGTLFLDKRFVSVGFKPSQTPGSHGRIIKIWTLREYADSVKKFLVGQGVGNAN
jgi:hypothetical protein